MQYIADLWDNIKDWLYGTFVHNPIRLKESLERVINWIPVIWKNYDWDSHFLFEVMRYKLERMEKCIRVHGHHVENTKTAESIRKAKLILDRICKRDYLDNATQAHEKRWGDVSLGTEPVEGSPHLKRLVYYYERDLTDKEKEQERREFLKRGQHAEHMEKQDKEYLFKYILKHHKKWWD